MKSFHYPKLSNYYNLHYRHERGSLCFVWVRREVLFFLPECSRTGILQLRSTPEEYQWWLSQHGCNTFHEQPQLQCFVHHCSSTPSSGQAWRLCLVPKKSEKMFFKCFSLWTFLFDNWKLNTRHKAHFGHKSDQCLVQSHTTLLLF